MDSWQRLHEFSFIILVSILIPSSNIIAKGESDLTSYILYEANGSSLNGQDILSVHDIESHLNGKTVVLVHDENQSPETALVRELKDALLEARQTNVILVNWTATAHEPAGNYEDVASHLYDFIEDMDYRYLANLSDFHCIGFGVGAHICGIAGNLLKGGTTDPVLPRISGLNPKERFSTGTGRRMLSSGDAKFIDIIYTSPPGTLTHIGNVNYYANDYNTQPGCTNKTCSHERALQYYISSVRRACQFISKPCKGFYSWEGFDNSSSYFEKYCKSSEDNYGKMGYDSPEAPGRGIQYVKTTDTEPFC